MRVRPLLLPVLAGLVAAVLSLHVAPPAVATPKAVGAVHPALSALAKDFATSHAMRIVAFGSSSTEGVGASSPAASYPSRLQAELRAALPGVTVAVLNRGVGGEDAEDMDRRIPDLIAARPDLVIWQTGTNDPLRGLALARFTELTRQGLARFRAAGIDVLLMEPQDCPKFTAADGALAYRDAVRRLGAEAGVGVIRRYDLMARWLAGGQVTAAQLRAPDGLHMSDKGYALLAHAVATEILSGLAAPAPTS